MKKLFLSLLTTVFIAAFISAPVNAALTPEERSLYRTSGIIFYHNNGICMPPSSTDQPSGTISTGNTKTFLDRWHDTAVQIEILYGIPWEGAMAQAALESGWGTSHYALTKNAYFGVNAVDSNPDLGYAYPTAQLSWYGQGAPSWSYAEFIRDMPRYRNHGAFNYVSDPIGYVTAVKAAGYATDPNYVEKLANIINNIIRPYSQSQGWPDSAGIAATNPQAAENARKNAAGGEAGSGNENSYASTPGCTTGGTDGLPFNPQEVPSVHTTSCYGRIDSAHPEPHGGTDFGIPTGTPLYATASGTIVHVGRQNSAPDGYGKGGGWGYYVSIDIGGGTILYYGHMSDGSAVVNVGDVVAKGQLIGQSGNTGNSTGAHLHYEVRVNGNKVNPMLFMGDISAYNPIGCRADE